MVIVQHPSEPNPKQPTCTGEDIAFGRGSSAGRGYLVRSERSGPGVLLLHDWFGLADHVRDLAERLCSEGFTALAPDLYDGYVAPSPEDAEARLQATDRERMRKQLESARSFLTDNWHPRVGAIGFSLGGFLACEMGSRLEAVVIFYTTGPLDPSTWTAPLQVHLAETDEFEPEEEMSAFLASAEASEVELDVHTYPGTTHWFANPAVRSAYVPRSAEIALDRAVDHLRHHLA